MIFTGRKGVSATETSIKFNCDSFRGFLHAVFPLGLFTSPSLISATKQVNEITSTKATEGPRGCTVEFSGRGGRLLQNLYP